jgi:DNA-binding NarL/FixJ family response regulator
MVSKRIILADDHALILDTLKNLLEPEFEVVGTFTDGHTLIEKAPCLNPNVVVLDVAMPTMNGLNAGEHLKQLLPTVKLIYLTMNQDPDMAAEAFRLGASGYVLKHSAASELVTAIRQALWGGIYVAPQLTKDMDGSFIQELKQRERPRELTLRQKEVLQLLVEGRSMKEVAFILNVTTRTVAFHKYAMMEHLQLKTSAELIQYALRSSTLPT